MQTLDDQIKSAAKPTESLLLGMAKVKSKTKRQPTEMDSVFFLKIVMYLVLGSLYIRLVNPSLTDQIPIPVGLLLGLLFVSHDHFKIDRKIEISVLLVSALVGFWVQTGAAIVVLP